jgi:parallel beta-helix repeat protein
MSIEGGFIMKGFSVWLGLLIVSLFFITVAYVYGAEKNIALNAKVEVSSTFNDKYVGENAIDGNNDQTNPDTRWLSGKNPPHWLILDFGKPMTIVKVNLYFSVYLGLSWGSVEYVIQYEKDGEWVDIPGTQVKDGKREDVTKIFVISPPISAQRLRFYCIDGCSYDTTWGNIVRLSELEVFAEIEVPSAANTETHYVNANSPNPQPPFTTPETAAIHIMDAVNVAENGDTVQVAAGIYRENVKIQKDVSLIGAGADKTTIDGGGNGSVVTAEYIKSPTKISGFTITNGKATGGGGGFLIRWCSSLTIENNIITGNTVTDFHGGGIYCQESSAITFSNNIVQNNSAFRGSGIYVNETVQALICYNQIVSNIARNSGGGIYWSGSSGAIYGNTIKSNVASGIGVGNSITRELGSSITISNNLIINNKGGSGIRINTYGGLFTVINNTIVGNEAREGGGIYCWAGCYSCKVNIRNNIIVGNPSTEGAGGIQNIMSVTPLTIDYNDVWNNTGPKGDYAGCTPGVHDIHTDPLFVNPQNPSFNPVYDFHLKPGSPCIDAGNPESDYSNEPQPNGGRINMGAYGNTLEAEASPLAPWDVNQDGIVDISDLVIVGKHFGERPPTAGQNPDVNGDDTVDISDLVLVSIHFGK